MGSTSNFSFDLIRPERIGKIINNLDTSKTAQRGDISTKTTIDNKDFFSYFIFTCFNIPVNEVVFPDELKDVDIKPICKKESKNGKESYRPFTKFSIKSLNVVCIA